MSKTVFISAGDPSGDIHASKLMAKLKLISPDIKFIGIGGKNMEAEGLESLTDIKDISVVGFLEVAKKLRFFTDLMNKCKKSIIDNNVDIFIPVDYPGFNIKLASFCKKNNIPVTYYIAPQLWAWGKNRAKKLTDTVDKLLVVFPFEKEYFANYGINTEFIGHPLMDNPKIAEDFDSKNKRLKIIALLPGSRKQEIQKHLDLFSEIAKEIKRKLPDYRFLMARTQSVDEIYFKFKRRNIKIEFFDDSIELMQKSKAGIVKTGTSNLEAALCGMPFSMVYKTSLFTYLMGRMLINLPYISIVNILQNKAVINEFIQNNLNPVNIADDIVNIIETERYNNIQSEFLKIKKLLNTKNASENAAKIISEYL